MNQIVKDHLVSALQTFLATFLMALGTGLASGHMELTWAFAASVVVTAGRAAVKALFQQYAPISLGGLKK